MSNDPISDLLTRIRNAHMAKHRYVDIHFSKHVENILKVLENQGFITKYLADENKRTIRVFLKYSAGRKAVITGLKRLSKPGLRRYVPAAKIPKILSGLGITMVSTSQGVMDGESAREKGIGGELLCAVW